MSGEVTVLTEPNCYVVACFKTECPEHANSEPWVSEHAEMTMAITAARQHRAFVREYWLPDLCEACGQRRPNSEAIR